MNARNHWEAVYRTRKPETVSWYRPHLDRSLDLIGRAPAGRSAAINDVGGGESTLVDDLLARGYRDICVLDISQVALDVAKRRLGADAVRVEWCVADIGEAVLPDRRYDVWHDRAVFHFLTRADQRKAYVRQVARAMKPGGHVIVATFGQEGPMKCSGLDVLRYDAPALHGEFGPRFRLLESVTEVHKTPGGRRSSSCTAGACSGEWRALR
jgi:2-polyprenyl-3-methyl-5-hydroxy-6-metoxy-1,4-benzoquinol methylase